ncbi:hypothetical protein LC593_13675 [Nostoc sp. CHAB 5844]|nr:hypothetical protein [Nostoc sp. CHAB 5844]
MQKKTAVCFYFCLLTKLGEEQRRAGVPPVEAIAGTETDTATPVRSSRETLSAVAHGGNPQDRAASPRD